MPGLQDHAGLTGLCGLTGSCRAYDIGWAGGQAKTSAYVRQNDSADDGQGLILGY